jgi:hypothetical protein
MHHGPSQPMVAFLPWIAFFPATFASRLRATLASSSYGRHRSLGGAHRPHQDSANGPGGWRQTTPRAWRTSEQVSVHREINRLFSASCGRFDNDAGRAPSVGSRIFLWRMLSRCTLPGSETCRRRPFSRQLAWRCYLPRRRLMAPGWPPQRHVQLIIVSR